MKKQEFKNDQSDNIQITRSKVDLREVKDILYFDLLLSIVYGIIFGTSLTILIIWTIKDNALIYGELINRIGLAFIILFLLYSLLKTIKIMICIVLDIIQCEVITLCIKDNFEIIDIVSYSGRGLRPIKTGLKINYEYTGENKTLRLSYSNDNYKTKNIKKDLKISYLKNSKKICTSLKVEDGIFAGYNGENWEMVPKKNYDIILVLAIIAFIIFIILKCFSII